MTTQTVEGAIQEAEAGLVNYQEPRIGLAGWVKGLFLDTLRGERKSGTNTQGAAGKVIARAKAKMALELDFRQPYDTNQYLDPRITFSRLSTGNSAGTYFGSDGLLKEAKVNLLLQSNSFDTTWSVARLAAPTKTGVTAPDGAASWVLTEDATAANTHAILQNHTVAATTAYIYSVYLKAGTQRWVNITLPTASFTSGDVYFDLVTGTKGTEAGGATGTITSVGSGWYRCTVSKTSTTGGSGNILIYSTDSGSSITVTTPSARTIYVYGAQLETGSTASPYIATQAAASAAPRIDFDPVTLECKGLLIEESRANLHPASNSWSNNSGVSQTTVAQNYASPSGSADAWTVTEGGAGYQFAYGVAATVSTTAAAHTYSAFVKAGTATRCQLCTNTTTSSFYANFGLSGDGAKLAQSGTTDYGIQKLANGWYRIWAVVTTAAASVGNPIVSHINSDSATRLPSYTGTGLTLYLFGGQVELGSFPTSYIPTTTASLTRAADSCSMTGTNFSGWWNATEGTFVVGWQSNVPTATQAGILCAQNTLSDRVSIRLSGTANLVNPAVVASSAVRLDAYPASVLNGNNKASIAYADSSYAATSNGIAPTTASSGTVPSGVSALYIGYFVGPGYLNGHISRLVYFNKRLPDATLRSLTA